MTHAPKSLEALKPGIKNTNEVFSKQTTAGVDKLAWLLRISVKGSATDFSGSERFQKIDALARDLSVLKVVADSLDNMSELVSGKHFQ